MFGLKEREISDLCNGLRKFPEIERAVVFGSRAMGNYKSGSDLDLALFGEELNFRHISGILNIMEESVFPYALDLVIYDRVENPKLREHIDRFGRELYRK